MLNESFWKKYFKYYDYLNVLIPYQDLIGEFVRESEDIDILNVLDAGAGTGNVSVNFSDKAEKVYAIDYSKEGLDVLKQKDPSIETVVHDLREPLPFEDGHFEVIVSNNTLYTLKKENLDSVFKEFYRVLRPGGIIIISNLKKGFNPFVIYIDHIKKSFVRFGTLRTFLQILKLIIPTLKIFYYNYLITKQKTSNYNFFETGEQKELLLRNGFKEVTEEKAVYSNQGLLVKGIK